jgi:hypothetical protein
LTVLLLFLFRKSQSEEFTSRLKTKSQHHDLQAPNKWEAQNICKTAAEEEESGQGSRQALALREEKTHVSVAEQQMCGIP